MGKEGHSRTGRAVGVELAPHFCRVDVHLGADTTQDERDAESCRPRGHRRGERGAARKQQQQRVASAAEPETRGSDLKILCPLMNSRRRGFCHCMGGSAGRMLRDSLFSFGGADPCQPAAGPHTLAVAEGGKRTRFCAHRLFARERGAWWCRGRRASAPATQRSREQPHIHSPLGAT